MWDTIIFYNINDCIYIILIIIFNNNNKIEDIIIINSIDKVI